MMDRVETNSDRMPAASDALCLIEHMPGAPEHPGRAALDAPPTQTLPGRDAVLVDIYNLGATRAQTIRQQIRMTNSCRAYVGRWLGFRTDLPEAERAAINRRTAALIKAVEKGDTPKRDAELVPLVLPFILATMDGLKPFDALRRHAERLMPKMVEQLPAWEWVKSVRGFGALGFAIILAETGDLSDYANPAKVWKRLGLGLVNGKRQGAPGQGATADDWKAHGYNPRRRSLVWTIGDSLLKGNGDGPYRALYLAKKAELMTREGMTKMHAHRMAQRYMEKRLIRDLWRAWRDDLKA